MKKSGLLFIVSAPSGAGKTTLVNAVLERLKSTYVLDRVVTYTSKKPRSMEIPGKDYHYVTAQEFEQQIKDNFFLEWTQVVGNYYGTPASVLEQLEQGASRILIIDRVGAKEVVKRIGNAVLIWIQVPHISVLEQRLRFRGAESEDEIAKRMAQARQEVEAENRERLYSHSITNNVLHEAMRELEKIIKTKLDQKIEISC